MVEDTIPDGLTINSATVAPVAAGTCDVSGQDVECTIDLAVAASATITVNVTSTPMSSVTPRTAASTSTTPRPSASRATPIGEMTATRSTATICRPFVEKTAAGDLHPRRRLDDREVR